MNKRPALLIFDLDGTLLDSVPDLANSVNFALQNNGLPICTLDEIRSFVGNGAYVLCQRACKEIGKSLIDKVHQDFLTHYHQHTCIDSVPYAGVNDGLITLKNQGFWLAICTNKPSVFLPAIIGRFGWEFDLIIGGDSLPSKKPDPTPLLHICKQLAVTPNQAVMIGDSKNDIIAGQKAAMPTLALSYGYNYNEPIANQKPNKVFDKFEQLVQFLVNLPK